MPSWSIIRLLTFYYWCRYVGRNWLRAVETQNSTAQWTRVAQEGLYPILLAEQKHCTHLAVLFIVLYV